MDTSLRCALGAPYPTLLGQSEPKSKHGLWAGEPVGWGILFAELCESLQGFSAIPCTLGSSGGQVSPLEFTLLLLTRQNHGNAHFQKGCGRVHACHYKKHGCFVKFFFVYTIYTLHNGFLQLIEGKEEMPTIQYTSVTYSCQAHSGLFFTDLIIPHFMAE